MLSDPAVLEAIDARRLSIARLANISPALVLKQWLAIATADPAKLIRVRRLNCRYCWGDKHRYHWAEWEYADTIRRVMEWKPGRKETEADRPAFPDIAGGMGFLFNADPCPDCPRCLGEGVVDVFVADSSTLTGPERALFAGVKMTKDGIQVLMHDQMAIWNNLRDYFGMTVKAAGTPPPTGWPKEDRGDVVDVEEVLPDDPVKLALMYTELTKGAS